MTTTRRARSGIGLGIDIRYARPFQMGKNRHAGLAPAPAAATALATRGTNQVDPIRSSATWR